MQQCPKCKVIVHNLRKHLDRNRCQWQHIRKKIKNKSLKKEKEENTELINPSLNH